MYFAIIGNQRFSSVLGNRFAICRHMASGS